MNIGVVLAGGVGNRVGSDIPKQYLQLNGKEVISYPINILANNKNIDKVIVAADASYHNKLKSCYNIEVCLGGLTRNETVRNVIDYILEKQYKCENIVFVDSARPLLSDNMIDEGLKNINANSGVITCQYITDSLGYEMNLIQRDKYYLIQTPEIFKFDKLINYDKKSEKTAIFQQVEGLIFKNFINECNLKLTYISDLKILESILK